MTKLKERKAQSLQILMFSLVIIGIGAGLLAFSNLSAAPVIFEDTMEDAPLISESQARTSDAANYYVPLAAHYSVTQAAYDDGQTVDTLETQSDIDNHYLNTISAVSASAEGHYYDYPDDLEYRRCAVDIKRKDIDFSADNAYINITNVDPSENWVETTCRIDGSTVKTSSDIEKIQKNTSNLRFQQLMTMTLNGIQAMHDKASTIESNNNYEGSETGDSCDASYSTAKNLAEADGRGDAQTSLDNLVDSIENAGANEVDNNDDDTGLLGRAINYVLPWTDGDFSDDFSEQSRSDDIITVSTSASRSSFCPCDTYNSSSPPRHCISYEYDGDADIDWELHQVTIRSTVEDTEYEIPVDTGWENLQIKRDFFHNFPVS